jgi:hypothetical protein
MTAIKSETLVMVDREIAARYRQGADGAAQTQRTATP